MLPETQQRRWMAQWSAGRPALRVQRARELAAMTNEQALAAAADLLSIGDAVELPPALRATSGLVRQQVLFHGGTEP